MLSLGFRLVNIASKNAIGPGLRVSSTGIRTGMPTLPVFSAQAFSQRAADVTQELTFRGRLRRLLDFRWASSAIFLSNPSQKLLPPPHLEFPKMGDELKSSLHSNEGTSNIFHTSPLDGDVDVVDKLPIFHPSPSFIPCPPPSPPPWPPRTEAPSFFSADDPAASTRPRCPGGGGGNRNSPRRWPTSTALCNVPLGWQAVV